MKTVSSTLQVTASATENLSDCRARPHGGQSFSVAVGITLGFMVSLSCVGCAQRAFFDPRSEIIANAQSKGVAARSIEEDRELFFAQETTQRKRLQTLIAKRSEPEFKDSSYRLGAGDDIEINVFDVPELNVTTKIRQSGFLSLPLIGAVNAIGLTESELVEQLRSRLKTFVRDPQVSVFVTNYGSQKVAVMGAVRTPGNIPLKKGANSILELIAQAGGVSERAGNYINFIPSEVSGIANSAALEGGYARPGSRKGRSGKRQLESKCAAWIRESWRFWAC
jgi:protein involved in polysaccharide export with SLBB domain